MASTGRNRNRHKAHLALLLLLRPLFRHIITFGAVLRALPFRVVRRIMVIYSVLCDDASYRRSPVVLRVEHLCVVDPLAY